MRLTPKALYRWWREDGDKQRAANAASDLDAAAGARGSTDEADSVTLGMVGRWVVTTVGDRPVEASFGRQLGRAQHAPAAQRSAPMPEPRSTGSAIR